MLVPTGEQVDTVVKLLGEKALRERSGILQWENINSSSKVAVSYNRKLDLIREYWIEYIASFLL